MTEERCPRKWKIEHLERFGFVEVYGAEILHPRYTPIPPDPIIINTNLDFTPSETAHTFPS